MIESLRRSKMVSFRLSLEEYARFQTICEARGIRSLSDLARTAVQNLGATKERIDPLWNEIGILRHQIRALSAELDRLSRALEARQPDAEADTSFDTAHGRG